MRSVPLVQNIGGDWRLSGGRALVAQARSLGPAIPIVAFSFFRCFPSSLPQHLESDSKLGWPGIEVTYRGMISSPS